jgi:hypothetical protein
MANPLRGRLMVGRLTLDQVVKVRVLAPQLSEDPASAGFCLSAKGGDLTDEADVNEPCPSISRPRPDDRVRRRVQLRQETVRHASSPRRRGAGGCALATRGRAHNARENLFDRGESRDSDAVGEVCVARSPVLRRRLCRSLRLRLARRRGRPRRRHGDTHSVRSRLPALDRLIAPSPT